jgi:hypothetical protein
MEEENLQLLSMGNSRRRREVGSREGNKSFLLVVFLFVNYLLVFSSSDDNDCMEREGC